MVVVLCTIDNSWCYCVELSWAVVQSERYMFHFLGQAVFD